MASAFTYLVVGLYSKPRAILLIIGLCYIVVSIFALIGKRWAIGFSVLTAILLMLRWLPMVTINTWMFLSGHELYRDSPATILVVLSYALVFALPATVLCVLYIFQRKNVLRVIRHSE